MKRLILLIAMLSLAYAQSSLVDFLLSLNQKTGPVYNWFIVGFLGIIISIAIAVLMFELSNIFGIPYLKAMFNIEMKEVLFTVFLLLLLHTVVDILDLAFKGLGPLGGITAYCHYYDQPNCIISTTVHYIDDNIELSKRALSNLLSRFEKTSRRSSLSLAVGIDKPEFGYASISYALGSSGGDAVESRILWEQLTQTLSLSFGFREGLLFIIQFIGPVALSMGAVFRCFMPTRRLGATLIGVGFSFFYALPLLLLFFYSINESEGIGLLNEETHNCPPECGPNNIIGFSDNEVITTSNAGDYLASASPEQVSKFLEGEIKELNINGNHFISCEFISQSIGKNVFASFPDITKERLKKLNESGVDIYFSVLQCPKVCRRIPYPSDIPICRDAETTCSKMFEIAPKCFKKDYDFSLLQKEFIAPDGSKKALAKLLLETKCFDILPLKVPYKSTPFVYCPKECRFYYNTATSASDGPCKGDKKYGTYMDEPVDFDKWIEKDKCNYEFKKFNKLFQKIICKPDGSCEDMYKGSFNPSDIYSKVEAMLRNPSPSNINEVESMLKNIQFRIVHKDEDASCYNLIGIPDSFRHIPPFIDCSKCYGQEQSLTSNSMPYIVTARLFLENVVIPTIALALTMFAGAGLSQYLGGEMFVPGYGRL